jgi:hypothetical protein
MAKGLTINCWISSARTKAAAMMMTASMIHPGRRLLLLYPETGADPLGPVCSSSPTERESVLFSGFPP